MYPVRQPGDACQREYSIEMLSTWYHPCQGKQVYSKKIWNCLFFMQIAQLGARTIRCSPRLRFANRTRLMIQPLMRCPECGCQRIFRDRYAGLSEFLRFTPFRPYGCRECHHHFISWRRHGTFLSGFQHAVLRLFLVFSASCPNCRSREVERVNPATVLGTLARAVARKLRFPAFRCAKCGKKFFKFRWHVRYMKTATDSR